MATTRLRALPLLLAAAACAAPGADRALLGSPSASRWRTEVRGAAQEMIGVPYRYGGRTPAGFDCSGLVAYSYARAGLTGLPRTAAGLSRISAEVPLGELLPGDLLFFSFGRGGISHVALYVGEGRFVHARRSGRRVEQTTLDDPYWGRALARAGRLFGP